MERTWCSWINPGPEKPPYTGIRIYRYIFGHIPLWASLNDELPLTHGAAVTVARRPAAAVLTSQAKPGFVKVHKSRTSAKQSKQSTRRDLLMVLGKKPSPIAKVGGGGSAKKDGAQQFPRVVWALLRAI
jgi:hypothetical protein